MTSQPNQQGGRLDVLPWRIVDLLAILAIAMLWVVVVGLDRTLVGEALVDDAYIFVRVLDNLVAGHGWVYNEGLNTNAITAPLYVLYLAVFRLIPVGVPYSVSAAYMLALAVLGASVYVGARPMGRVVAFVLGVVACAGGVLARSWGMETSLFLALVVCASLAFDKRMDGVTGVLCGLASLTRPEGAAMVFVFAAIYVHKWRAIPWRMLCASALVAIPWFAYSYVQFGHVLPNSVAIKAAQHQVGWFKTQPTWFLTFLGQARHPWATYPLALVGVGALVKTYLKTRESFFLPIIMFALVQIAVYSIMSAPSGYFWYYAIGNMAVDLCVALGLMAVWRAAQSRMRKMESTTWSMWGFGVVMIVLSGVFSMAGFKSLHPMRLSVEYTAAGQWIAVNTPLNAVVAAAEIGYIGHYSGREIRDMHGLIHPGALAFIKKEQWDWWFVEHRPGVIVTHQPRWDGEPDVTRGWRQENHDAFLRDYRLVQEFGAVQVYVAADQCLAGKLAENPN